MHRKFVNGLLITIFAIILAGATAANMYFIEKSRKELARTVLLNPSTAKNLEKHIIAILPAVSDPAISNIYRGIQLQAEESETALQVFYYNSETEISGNLLTTEAYQYFDIAIRAAPNGLIMYFPPGEDIESFANKAQSFHVPFIPVALDMPRTPLNGLVTSDSYIHGKEAASIALDVLGTDARIGVILPSRTPNSFTIAEEPFFQGATQELIEKNQGKIIAVEREEESILGSEEACSTMLQNYPEINIFICTNARSTISVAQVIVDRWLVGTIAIIGADENIEIDRLLEKGIVQATVVRDAVQIGKTAVKTLEQLEAGIRPSGVIKVNSKVKYGRSL